MNYVVVVLEPIPQDLAAVARSVAERFKISQEKAMALLQRAPGAVTKTVPESQALTVAGILSEAGLLVEVREEHADGRPLPLFAAAGATADSSDATREPHEQAYQPLGAVTVTGGAGDPDRLESSSGATGPGDADHEASVRDTDAYGYGDDRYQAGDVDPSVRSSGVRSTVTTTGGSAREVPEPGHATTTPPRDPMKTTLTREPPDLERSGLRRRIATAATLPALLTLVVTLLALAVTLLPVLRSHQARRASDSAVAVAATLEGLSGGLPLSAPMIRAELRQVEERTRSQLAPRGVSFMTVLDADGTPLLAWDVDSPTSGSLSLEAGEAARVAASAAADGGAAPANDLMGNLRASFGTLKAMVGLGSEEAVTAAALVRRNGQQAGTVIVGVDPASLRTQLGQVLLTTLLVGLIPVLFAVLAALSLTRGLTDAIRYLLVAADRISHGDFERPVELERDDELGQIGKAVERMRLSLHESMERLRRRR